ncbi:hypothetical protein [Promicromonospora sp. NPDC059942]|uniref:hypothetical protein n=1 Tax=Promicromonospora sp. NPDC059942 TaxID=3347009 RepID=UPI00364A0FDE
MRWPWERSWIRRAEEVVDRELARWFDPPRDGTPVSDDGSPVPDDGSPVPDDGSPVPDAPDDEAVHVENPDGTGARPG